ncbi:hypothetical protein BGZ46_008692 [Entomortierella lignicola]|nr:hypothetical protein BGZ46_008692 [Entomortierella lignicola]
MSTSKSMTKIFTTINTFHPTPTTTTYGLISNAPPSTLTSPSSTITNSTGNSTSGSDGYDGFQTSGGYIYLILFFAMITAAIYFTRVALAKRKERQQLLKEQDCEVPPGYSNHGFDMLVMDSSSPNSDPNSSSNSNNPSSLPEVLTASQLIITIENSIQAPARALTRTPPPPAYDEVPGLPKVIRSPSSNSIISNTTTVASAPRSSRLSGSSRQ